MRNEGVGSWPERRLRINPESDALWFEDVTTSYYQLGERVRRAAAALAGVGVGPGDRVAWIGGNHPSALETLFACGQLGAIWVPVNARLSVPEAQYVLDHSCAKVVVHGRDQGLVVDALRAVTATRCWIAAEPPVAGSPESLPYEELLADVTAEPRDLPVSLDDTCLVMYTSGTTGRPKGATLTHGNVTYACLNQILGVEIDSGERTLAIAPLFHIGGLNSTVNPALLRGGCAVLMRSFEPTDALAVIEAQRVNSFFAVPTMLDALARSPSFATADLSSLRTVVAAGAPVPLPTLHTWLDRGVAVQQAYGMTETAPTATVLDVADATAKIGSAGKPQFFTDVRVVRSDGTEVAPGEVGEVVVHGPNVMAGYWNDPDATAAVLVDGWYHSGDAATIDDDGYLYIRDRYKDMIISGGENVYPAEIESALHELPEVMEAAVIGVPDSIWGEVAMAIIVVSPDAVTDADQLRTALRQQLAGYKVPRHFRFIDELPKTATGKIRKPDLRNHYRQDLP